MGSYDEVHTGDRCGQTKALGKGLRALTPGDHVVLGPAVMTEEQFREHGHDMPPRPEVVDFDAVMAAGFLHVREARVRSWDDERDLQVPLFDYHGWPAPEPERPSSGERDGGVRPGGCQVCAQVRGRRPGLHVVR